MGGKATITDSEMETSCWIIILPPRKDSSVTWLYILSNLPLCNEPTQTDKKKLNFTKRKHYSIGSETGTVHKSSSKSHFLCCFYSSPLTDLKKEIWHIKKSFRSSLIKPGLCWKWKYQSRACASLGVSSPARVRISTCIDAPVNDSYLQSPQLFTGQE